MGASRTTTGGTGENKSQTTFQGSPYFDQMAGVFAKDYGQKRSMADLILGGKQYGAARNFLGDEYRDLTPQQAQSVQNARSTARQTAQAPSYQGADGTIWQWDNKQGIFVGWGKDDNGNYTQRTGGWSPYDKNHPNPPWKPTGNSTGGGTPPPSPPPPPPSPPPYGSPTKSVPTGDTGLTGVTTRNPSQTPGGGSGTGGTTGGSSGGTGGTGGGGGGGGGNEQSPVIRTEPNPSVPDTTPGNSGDVYGGSGPSSGGDTRTFAAMLSAIKRGRY